MVHLIDSIKEPIELLEYVFQRLLLKERSFRILATCDVDEINSLVHSQLDKIHPDLKNMKSFDEISKKIYENHVCRRTYYIQIRKCGDINCEFHDALRGIRVS